LIVSDEIIVTDEMNFLSSDHWPPTEIWQTQPA